ncbi:AraC family transcriptional regulator [Rhodobacter capsulatus]|uniref:AraC family transcriptional regulator n=1 Tax=Rhodobacter capsulatus TaxID=1061 RepID=UPI004028112A
MRLALLAYDGISPFLLSTPLAVFGEPFVQGPHHVDICAATSGLCTSAGLRLEGLQPLALAAEADLVILPGWRDAAEPVSPEIVAALTAAAARGAIVVGLCLGAFGLAQAGLLDGRRATTHWARAETFARRFPRVQVDVGALFVDEGAVVTSAGVAAGLDCCLHLLARLSGLGEANRVARHLVVAPQRSGGAAATAGRPRHRLFGRAASGRGAGGDPGRSGRLPGAGCLGRTGGDEPTQPDPPYPRPHRWQFR